MNHAHRPRIAITMGDPGGIGPEIIAKALAENIVQCACEPLIVGSRPVIEPAIDSLKDNAPETPEIVEPDDLPRVEFKRGEVHATNGAAAAACIRRAVQMVQSGLADAICTAPISKEALFAAGIQFPGHTEMLAHLCGDAEVRMMLEGGGLHVALETIHVALSQVPHLLTTSRIVRTLEIMSGWAGRHMPAHKRIAVCGLNPHASEAGHFGNEEAEVISPAIQQARDRGIDVTGPLPADTVFHRVLQGEFDLVLAMYHDQALIPVKTLDFDHGVNVTLGLPIVRTSPDHGTAFDIAGRGIARHTSMIAALLRAAELASH